MKKLIAILLAALMICSLFVGCAKTEEPVVEPETETEAPAVEGEESLMDKYGFEELDIHQKNRIPSCSFSSSSSSSSSSSGV